MKTIKLNYSLLFILILTIISCGRDKNQQPYHEQFRPQFHFSPPEKWMNDPNGLVYFEGEYHLFYQFFPDSTVWGPMHWGHAVSKDLLHWENLPIALYPDTLGYIFSGSAVIDYKNTSGLQAGSNPPMIAIFTQHSEERAKKGQIDIENQSIAYSLDKGRTFTKYTHNPVIINPGERDFRDPKVSWNDSLQKWIMVLAVGQKVKFYSSLNLLQWDYLSDFGNDAGAHGGVWECPDFFPLKVGDVKKWVLVVNINPGAPNGGSGVQYFVGNFDGTNFINDNPKETKLWLDYGPDDYAGVTWSDIPAKDGRRIFMGWMSNWAYAQKVPTVKWRNAMTIARTLELKKTTSGLRVYSNPVKEMEILRNAGKNIEIKPGSEIKITGLNEIVLTAGLNSLQSDDFGFIFSGNKGEKMIVGFDKQLNQYYSDRTGSGKTDFSPDFARKHFAPRLMDGNNLKIQLFLDHSSLEMFFDEGITSMTETFFPDQYFSKVSFFQKGGNNNVQNLIIYDLNPVW